MYETRFCPLHGALLTRLHKGKHKTFPPLTNPPIFQNHTPVAKLVPDMPQCHESPKYLPTPSREEHHAAPKRFPSTTTERTKEKALNTKAPFHAPVEKKKTAKSSKEFRMTKEKSTPNTLNSFLHQEK